MDGLSVDLTAQTEASNAADTALQNNIDTLTGTVNGLGLQIVDGQAADIALSEQIDAVEAMVNGNGKAIEGLKTLPEDLATLKEDTETELAALGGNTTALTGRVDGLESKVDSLEVSFISILSLKILLIILILTQGNVNTLTTTLSEQTATSQSEDIKLQSNIDAVQAACEAKIAELQTEFNTKLDQRDQKISQIESQTEV